MSADAKDKKEQEACLHCRLIEALDQWAIDQGHVNEHGHPDPEPGDIAQGVGHLIADLVAMAGTPQEAGEFFRAFMHHAQEAYPEFREFYRKLDDMAERGELPPRKKGAQDGIHGMLETAIFKGKPN